MPVSFGGQLVSVITDYSFKLCEMSLHVVSVGLLQNVAKKNMRTHIWCPSESLAAFMMISENV